MFDDNSSPDVSTSGDETLSESDTEDTESDHEGLDGELFGINDESFNEQKIDKNSKYIRLILQINKPKFGDITPMINSAVPFLIDGDALMLSALNQKNHGLDSGGQFLHVTYYCERILDILGQKGGHFIIVFFDVWKLVWDNNWYLQTCRLSLYNHLRHNTCFTVRKYCTFYSPALQYLIKNVKPRCVFLHLSIYEDMQQLNRNLKTFGRTAFLNETRAVRLFCGEIMAFFQYGLSCIDVDEIHPDVSIISSFHLEIPKISNRMAISQAFEKEIEKDYGDLLKQTVKSLTTINNYVGEDVRRVLVIIAGSKFLKAKKEVAQLKLILVSCASQEVLKLENRGCSNLQVDKKCAEKFQRIILDWHEHLYFVLNCIKNENFKWNNIADLWQGTLFSNISAMITTKITNGKELGFFQESYEDLIHQIERESGEHIDPYPIEPLNEIKWHKCTVLEKKSTKQVIMQPVQNTLIQQFCGNIFEGVSWANPREVFARKHFKELRHWHSRKPLTDEYDHIRGTFIEKPSSKSDLKRQKGIAKHSRYMNVYGRNLEGNKINPEIIICKDEGPSGSKKDTNKKKERKKVIEMKEKLQQDKQRNQRDKDFKLVSDFKLTVNKHNSIEKQKIRLEEVNNLLLRLSEKDALLKANIMKLRILMYISQFHETIDCLMYVKEIFLTIRKVLHLYNHLTEKQEKLISLLLHKFGFDEIAQRNNLPEVQCDKSLELDWIRYQLEYIGPDLEKDVLGMYDPDIRFTPDLWQTEFINAIRRNESALVVAPTSSGKTFASYYCMKRVLQETRTGIVVYVAPTKALVNQVAATVYHRFSKVNLRDGVSVVGVFTRDFKTNALNSRILITVPQCLDILLLSPRRYSWVKNIKYVIFDEVHQLSGMDGLVWERCLLMIRCPFLALSATVSEPEYFHRWLQHIENFKKDQIIATNPERASTSYRVNLVQLSERHSDLIKYTYGRNGLTHFHPFCALDNYALDMHDGIPPTITLSPYETLQLYDAIYSSTNSGKLLPSELHIEEYFKKYCPSGFIKREMVRNYEKELGQAFYDIYKKQNNIYTTILQHLHKENPMGKFDNIEKLLNIMERKNMLPTLVFSYDRKLVEELHKVAIERTYKLSKRPERNTKKVSAAVRKIIEKENKACAKNKEKRRGEDEYKKGKLPMMDLWEKSGNDIKKFDDSVKYYGDRFRQRWELPSLNILSETYSKFKGIGCADKDDLKFIENRLSRMGFREGHTIIKGFQLGFAYHHGGLNNTIRSSVEMLFRLGVVKVVFATGTLAVGIHMPCKSVVVCGDSQFLNSLEYHQMSGRAGRRGFDIEGNVIFINIDEKRRDRLITDKLPKMIGSYPISVTLVLRLLLLVNTVTDKNCVSEEATNVTLSRVLVLLQNSLIFQSKPQLVEQIKHFVGFASQLLLMQDIIDSNGSILKLGGLITHLHYHEPANLAFAYLLRLGIFRKLLKIGDDKDIQWSLIVVLSHLFARIKLHKTQFNHELKNSVVTLEPLPDIVKEALEQYNSEVKFIFSRYIRNISVTYTDRYGPDDILPLSNIKIQPLYNYENATDVAGTLSSEIKKLCPSKQACSAFVALSGDGDDNLFTHSAINNVRHQICPDINAIPLIHLDEELNSYAADFYRHGIKKAIVRDNGIRGGQEFTVLKDFMLVLKVITVSLEELEPKNLQDPIIHHFVYIKNRFEELFKKAFNISEY